MEGDRKKQYEERKKKRKLEILLQGYEQFKEKESSMDSECFASSSDLEDFNINENFSSGSSSNSCNDSYLHSDNSVCSSESDFCEQLQIESGLVLPESEIDELREWVVANNIPHKHVDKLLKILRRKLLTSLPKCSKTFLKCEDESDRIEAMTVSNGSHGEFLYFGIKNQLTKLVILEFHTHHVLELIINIDGMSPFKSSPVCMWPILCKIYTKEDIYEPFTVAIYAGNGKPKSVSEYLQKFVVELNELFETGVIIQDKLFVVKVKFFVCDSPARSFLKCTVSHVSFNGCERCVIKGHKVDKVTVFLSVDEEKRTDEGVRMFTHPDCHTGVSPLSLTEPPINLVSQFVLDPMHLLYLGCTKRILEYLLSASMHKVRLGASTKSELIRRTKMIIQDIPIEFPRKMRSSEHHSKFKAVEYKFFSLYAAPIVLKKLLSDELYDHYMLFTVACRLLSDINCTHHTIEAREYFKEFVKKANNLYGSTFISLNIHNLIHVSDDVKVIGCNLCEISAYPFESYLGKITSVLRSPTHLVSQYAKRLKEQETFLKPKVNTSPEFQILVRKQNTVLKIKYKKVVLSLTHPNNTILLQDGSIADVNEFQCTDDQLPFIKVNKYLKKESVFKYPCDSSKLDIYKISRLANFTTRIPLDFIKRKVIKLKMNLSVSESTNTFITPLLH